MATNNDNLVYIENHDLEGHLLNGEKLENEGLVTVNFGSHYENYLIETVISQGSDTEAPIVIASFYDTDIC